MFGLFLVIPIFSLLALDLKGATPLLIGLAFGGYGLTQACLQIPFGVWSDRIGRKPIIALGLGVFILGSALGMVAEDIYWMIVARLLQGAGAISSAVLALIADLTRPEVRARANAGLGASIGLAFGSAFFLAPFLGDWIGLRGVFGLITVVAGISLLILLFWVPSPPKPLPSKEPTRKMIQTVLVVPSLLKINLGGFISTLGLSATFFIIPLVLHEQGFAKSDLWKVYLPMLLLGGVTMIAAAILAETKNRFREVMLAGAGVWLLSFGCFWWGNFSNELFLYLGALFLFFMGFNVFEPLFPSLLTRLTREETKGTASGVYSFSNFMGHFVGASLAGLLYYQYPTLLFLILIALTSFFIYLLLSFPNPQKRKTPQEAPGGVVEEEAH